MNFGTLLDVASKNWFAGSCNCTSHLASHYSQRALFYRQSALLRSAFTALSASAKPTILFVFWQLARVRF